MADWKPENPYKALEYTPDGKLISIAFEYGVKETAKKLVKWLERRNGSPRMSKALEIEDVGHLMVKADDWQELKSQVGL